MSPYKSILVHLDSSPCCSARMRMAHALAGQQDAEVTALYAAMSIDLEFPFGFSPGIEAAALVRDLERHRRERARALFDDAVASGLVRLQWSELSVGQSLHAFTRRAMYSDLLVLGQHDPGSASALDVPRAFVEWVLIDSGKPALVMPFECEPPKSLCTALVAWKETRESARALGAALPLLRAAQQVHVATWGEGEVQFDDSRAPVLAYLMRHGVSAQLHHFEQVTPELGEALLALASDLGAGLLVMGCYGHARLREWVTGGVTSAVLSSMTLPVLMCH